MFHRSSKYDKSNHPALPASFARRRKWRLLVRTLFLSILTGGLYFGFSRASGEQYASVDPRGLEFVQKMCNRFRKETEQPLGETDEHLHHFAAQQARAPLPEHWQLPHIEKEAPPDEGPIDDAAWQHLPVKGVFYMVVRNEDIHSIRETMRSLEDRFNKYHRYPWVILSNEFLASKFRRYVSRVTTSRVYFGKIDPVAWDMPAWVSAARTEKAMRNMEAAHVYKGNSMQYRQRARYHSGFFFHHPLLQGVDYAWRVEAGSQYTCDMDIDPFLQMRTNNKTVGFAISARELPDASRSLWPVTRQFMGAYPQYILPDNQTVMPWIQDEAEEYNNCELWSNFAVVELAFFRSASYQEYFQFLDRVGGFFYERWSEGTVHTLAMAMFLRRDQIQYFEEVGYDYLVASHCPLTAKHAPKCACDVEKSFVIRPESCTIDLLKYIDRDALVETTNFIVDRLEADDLFNLGIGVTKHKKKLKRLQ